MPWIRRTRPVHLTACTNVALMLQVSKSDDFSPLGIRDVALLAIPSVAYFATVLLAGLGMLLIPASICFMVQARPPCSHVYPPCSHVHPGLQALLLAPTPPTACRRAVEWRDCRAAQAAVAAHAPRRSSTWPHAPHACMSCQSAEPSVALHPHRVLWSVRGVARQRTHMPIHIFAARSAMRLQCSVGRTPALGPSGRVT